MDPRQLSLSMRRELDWIVMRALEKDRNRRYESASQAERAWGEAVGAQKEAEKEKEAALAAQRLADERFKQSQADFARALKSLDTIVDEVSSPQFAQLPGAGPIRDRIIEQALKHYEQIVEDHSEDPYARQQQAIAYAQIGKILQVTSKHEEARSANDKSLAILESLYAEDPESTSFQLDLIDVLFKRAHTTGYTNEEKLRSAERALAVMAKAIESGKLKRFRHFALLHQVAANLLPADSPRAKELVDEIARIAEAHDFPPPPGTHAWLARRAVESEDYEKAEQLYRSCINTFKAGRTSPDRWISHNSQWWATQYALELARLLEQRDRPEDAEALYREALQLMTPLVQSYGQFPHYRREFTKSISSLVAIMVALNRHEQAQADLKRVIDRGDGTYYTRYQAALLSLKLADKPGYRKQCRQMLEAFADSDNPTETHFSAWTCALAENALDDYAPAIECARRAAEKEADNQQYRGGLGAILMRAGRYDESKAELERALQSADTEQTSTSYLRYFLSLVEHHRGDEEAAAEHLKAANEGSERELADAPPWNRELTMQLLRDEVNRLIGHRVALP
jgi:tetratricopeptide (TPR) repeat protein